MCLSIEVLMRSRKRKATMPWAEKQKYTGEKRKIFIQIVLFLRSRTRSNRDQPCGCFSFSTPQHPNTSTR
jgi:hypothetical protein